MARSALSSALRGFRSMFSRDDDEGMVSPVPSQTNRQSSTMGQVAGRLKDIAGGGRVVSPVPEKRNPIQSTFNRVATGIRDLPMSVKEVGRQYKQLPGRAVDFAREEIEESPVGGFMRNPLKMRGPRPQRQANDIQTTPTPTPKWNRVSAKEPSIIWDVDPSGRKAEVEVQEGPTVTPTPGGMKVSERRAKIRTSDSPQIPERMVEAIKQGFRDWAGLERQGLPDERIPVIEHADVFARESQKYPILRQYPYLLPALAIVETSGGQKQKYENNPMNWGIYVEGFNPNSPEESIRKAARGIGREEGLYQKFHETGNLRDFAYKYAPPEDGNDTENYLKDLVYLMDLFEKQERRAQ